MNLYLIYWIDPNNAYHGGHVLVCDTTKESAMRRGMAKATSMWDNAQFQKLEQIPIQDGVLWVDEWFS